MAPGAESSVPTGLGVRTRRPGIAMKSPVSLAPVSLGEVPSLGLGFPISKTRGLGKTSHQRVLADILVCFLLLTFQREQVQPQGEQAWRCPLQGSPNAKRVLLSCCLQFVLQLTSHW